MSEDQENVQEEQAEEVQDEQEEEVKEEKPAEKPKKHKKNLRVGTTKEEKSYADKNMLIAIASQAYQKNVQKNEVSLKKDAERGRKKLLAEQRKVEKRQQRLENKKKRIESIKNKELQKEMKKHSKKEE